MIARSPIDRVTLRQVTYERVDNTKGVLPGATRSQSKCDVALKVCQYRFAVTRMRRAHLGRSCEATITVRMNSRIQRIKITADAITSCDSPCRENKCGVVEKRTSVHSPNARASRDVACPGPSSDLGQIQWQDGQGNLFARWMHGLVSVLFALASRAAR